MRYSFFCKGHPNITANHPTTIEFTKDPSVSLTGDCILGVSATFDSKELFKFKGKSAVTCEFVIKDHVDKVTFVPCGDFSALHEFVLRKSNFISSRTFGLLASKAAIDINRKLVYELKQGNDMKVVMYD